VDPLRLSVLFVGLIERDAAALRGRLIDVPVEGVAARKEVPSPFAEGDLQRVRLRRVAVPLEVFPCPERRVGTAPALDLANRATCPVSLRGCEQRLVPRLELSRELEVLVLRFLLLLLLLLLMLLLRRWLLLHRHLLHTPLNPNQLTVHSLFPPPLLETWSLQGSMVNSLRVLGREPLRSASRLLGFTIDHFWDPGHRLVAGPSRGPRCFQDHFCLATPASFLGRHLMVVDRGPDALRLLPTAFTKGQHRRGCRRCCRSGPGKLADIPLQRRSAGTSISDAGYITTSHKRYSTHVVAP
jgi:hypothetical protein